MSTYNYNFIKKDLSLAAENAASVGSQPASQSQIKMLASLLSKRSNGRMIAMTTRELTMSQASAMIERVKTWQGKAQGVMR